MWFKFQIFLWYGAVTPRAQGSQEGAPLSEGPPSTSHTPAAPALPVTHIVPIAPVRSSYMSYIWLCFGMLKTTDDPPFPIYVLFFTFYFMPWIKICHIQIWIFIRTDNLPFPIYAQFFYFYFPFLKTMSYNVLRETRHLLTYCRILLHLRQDPAPVRRTQWGWQSAPRAPVLKLPRP